MIFNDGDRHLAARIFTEVADATISPQCLGVERASYGAGETAALHIIEQHATGLGLHHAIDGAGNLELRINQTLPTDPTAMGSHLDSVPRGGNFDGLAGVVAALLVLVKAKQQKVTKPLLGLGLRGEESAWFGVPYIGSKARLGLLPAADLQRIRNGVTLAESMLLHVSKRDLERIGEQRPLRPPISAFWELHIEQGPVLVDVGVPVGAVTAIRGNIRTPNARVLGVAGHSGTTPHRLRQDAVMRFAELMTTLEGRRERWDRLEDLVFTCGIVGTDPKHHALTSIADVVNFSLDIRGTDDAVARQFFDFAKRWAEETVHWGDPVVTPAAKLPERMTNAVTRACARLDIPCMELPSGAGHDAAVFQNAGIPSGMIFVRNANGSHNPDEAMDMGDFMLGVEALYAVVTA